MDHKPNIRLFYGHHLKLLHLERFKECKSVMSRRNTNKRWGTNLTYAFYDHQVNEFFMQLTHMHLDPPPLGSLSVL
jgi:hypothetical protein